MIMNDIVHNFIKLRGEAQKIARHSDDRMLLSQKFIAGILNSYTLNRQDFPVKPLINDLTTQMGKLAKSLDFNWAAYLIGTTYTALLPEKFRKAYGAYYTPPGLVSRLLELVEKNGIDWSKAKIIDPACGGGAFLAPVARKIANSLSSYDPIDRLQHIQKHLFGVEIDPFSAWMSRVFIYISLEDEIKSSKCSPTFSILNEDSLNIASNVLGKFDLVIGNPPYGKIRLSKSERKHWERSLYGHANLYGLFSDLAIRLASKDGTIGYVTPTSFLGGQYFKSLRSLFVKEAPPQYVSFVTQRSGVFLDALQETLLAVYTKNSKNKNIEVSTTTTQESAYNQVQYNGNYTLSGAQGSPWVLPRTPHQALLANGYAAMGTRLIDLGYSVSTGPLVWNRHKERLISSYQKGAVPLIWAECVDSSGSGDFSHKSTGRNHVPWYIPKQDCDPNTLNQPCVLVQRTTSIEQDRRLVAAVLPSGFLKENGGVVAIENHLNVVRSSPNLSPVVSLQTIAKLLNSKVVDQIFRCINGSTAVSAYELESIPFPTPQECIGLEKFLKTNSSSAAINNFIEGLYTNARIKTAA